MSANQRQQLRTMGAFERHKRLMHEYMTYYGGKLPPPAPLGVTDEDVLREKHRFIRTEADDTENDWQTQLAQRYYAKLYKEYCIADLSRYREGALGLRWRTEKEVIAGKGQFSCGAKGCDERRGLASFEVVFAYVEAGEQRQALVKLRVCPEHAAQLHYKKNKALRKQAAKRQRKSKGGADGETPEASGSGKKRRRQEGGCEDKTSSGDNAARRQPDNKAPATSTDGGLETVDGAEVESDNVWLAKPVVTERNKAEEFDEYFFGMFL